MNWMHVSRFWINIYYNSKSNWMGTRYSHELRNEVVEEVILI